MLQWSLFAILWRGSHSGERALRRKVLTCIIAAIVLAVTVVPPAISPPHDVGFFGKLGGWLFHLSYHLVWLYDYLQPDPVLPSTGAPSHVLWTTWEAYTHDEPSTRPYRITSDSEGNLYVVDDHRRIKKFSPDGTLLAVWGGEDHISRRSHPLIDITSDRGQPVRSG